MQVGLVVKSAVTELVIGPMRDDGALQAFGLALTSFSELSRRFSFSVAKE